MASLLLFFCFPGTALAALGWWILMPGGFPVDHPRFWVNDLLPPTTILLCLAGTGAIVRRRQTMVEVAAVTLGATGLGSVIAGWLIFPESWLLVLMPSLAFAAPFWLALPFVIRPPRTKRLLGGPLLPVVLAGLAIGAFLPFSQRGPDPATRPLDIAIPESTLEPLGENGSPVTLEGGATIPPTLRSTTIRNGESSLDVRPLLTFTNRSPDRFWTLFAPILDRGTNQPIREITAATVSPAEATIAFSDDGRSLFHVAAPSPAAPVTITAWSSLPRPIYSHLNTFCEVCFTGTDTLALSFSPCEEEKIAIALSGYPFGKPARLACVDKEGRFRVLEASSAEKGPFTTLAEGLLGTNDPLAITFHVGDRRVFRLTLHDWSAQASRDLSPTAGWGLPQNAIEFHLADAAPGVAHIFITLASTSIGRGYDSVGHAAGTYRNRIDIERL